jgi:hypothetical protein
MVKLDPKMNQRTCPFALGIDRHWIKHTLSILFQITGELLSLPAKIQSYYQSKLVIRFVSVQQAVNELTFLNYKHVVSVCLR